MPMPGVVVGDPQAVVTPGRAGIFLATDGAQQGDLERRARPLAASSDVASHPGSKAAQALRSSPLCCASFAVHRGRLPLFTLPRG